MIVYIVMLLISLTFLVIAQKVEKKPIKIILYILAVIPFFAVSACRYDVGTDYLNRYSAAFNRMSQGKDIRNLEIGFKLLIKFCLIFTQSPNLMFVITSGIIIVLIMTTIYTKSKNIILSVLVFFLGGFFFESLNLVRQYISISIILFAYRFISKEKNGIKNYIIYILCNTIAVLIHNSSAVGFILLFMNKKMLTNWKWVIPCSVLIIILNQRLINFVALIVQHTRFGIYLTGELLVGEVSILHILENALVYLFMSYIYYKNKKANTTERESVLLLNIQGLALITTTLGSVHILFSRIALYFSIFQIISIPYFITKIPVEEIKKDLNKILKNRVNIEKFACKIPLITAVIFVLGFMGLFSYTNIKNNDNEVVPYKTIFNHELKIN